MLNFARFLKTHLKRFLCSVTVLVNNKVLTLASPFKCAGQSPGQKRSLREISVLKALKTVPIFNQQSISLQVIVLGSLHVYGNHAAWFLSKAINCESKASPWCLAGIW